MQPCRRLLQKSLFGSLFPPPWSLQTVKSHGVESTQRKFRARACFPVQLMPLRKQVTKSILESGPAIPGGQVDDRNPIAFCV